VFLRRAEGIRLIEEWAAQDNVLSSIFLWLYFTRLIPQPKGFEVGFSIGLPLK
jgi:hypothetical protein